MKAVLLSVHPKLCYFIAKGKKTIMVTKTKPKLETQFKCFIYASKPIFSPKTRLSAIEHYFYKYIKGKVIGEFTCDNITDYSKAFFDEQEPRDTDEIAELLDSACLSYSELCAYVGLNDFYGWHISDLKIYDKPRELSEFYVEGDCDCMNCKNCAWFDKGTEQHKSFKPIMKSPRSWMYVENENNG